MDNWRPEDWEGVDGRFKNADHYCDSNIIFEAGADAMYEPAYQKGREEEREALKKRAIDPHEIGTYRFDKDNPRRISFSDEGFGFVVFIPDEEKED